MTPFLHMYNQGPERSLGCSVAKTKFEQGYRTHKTDGAHMRNIAPDGDITCVLHNRESIYSFIDFSIL